jgi:DNA-binding NtrC family response regulator
LPSTASKPAQQPAQQPVRQSEIKILYGESDEQILAAQAAEMAKAGHRVTTVLHRQGIQEALNHSTFDLVILGASLSKDDRHHLPYMVKKAHAGTKVLVMHAGTHHHEVDAAVDPNISMQRILEKITGLVSTSGRS